MNVSGPQALMDAVVEQRNAVMNQLAQANASMKVMQAEIDRLTEELARAKRRPKRKGARRADQPVPAAG